MLLPFALLVILSCSKNNNIENEGDGYAKAFRNGAEWKAICSSKKSVRDINKLVLGFEYYNSQHYLRNSFNFRYLPYYVGNYYPHQYQSNIPDSIFTISFYTLLEDGDVQGDKYVIIRDSAFFISIDHINYQTGAISGKFGGELIKAINSGQETDPSSPDTLKFEDGIFETIVKK